MNWIAFLALMLPVIGMFLWRMNIEEQALLQALGTPYKVYMTRTKRLLPFIY